MSLTKNFIFILAAAILLAANSGCSSNLTAQTTAEVTGVAIDRDTKTSRKKTSSNKRKKKTTVSIETEIDYRFTVNNQTFEGYAEKDGDQRRDFQTSSRVVVCYDPKNPAESEIFAAGHRCGT